MIRSLTATECDCVVGGIETISMVGNVSGDALPTLDIRALDHASITVPPTQLRTPQARASRPMPSVCG